MGKPLTILLFSILISFNSYGSGVMFFEHPDGFTLYVEKSKIKKENGYVYWQELLDINNNSDEFLSMEIQLQGDCGLNRFRPLSGTFYKLRMGNGVGETYNNPPKEWKYPPIGSVGMSVLDSICDYVK